MNNSDSNVFWPVDIPNHQTVLGKATANKRSYSFLPRDASAERGNATVSRPSVCLSVRPSVCDV